jgi:hypothetical protein
MSSTLSPDLREQAEAAYVEAYMQAEYALPLPGGGHIADVSGMLTEATFRLITSKALVSNRNERMKALTRVELVENLFPELPGADRDARDSLNEIDAWVFEKILRDLGTITAPGPGGAVQKRLGAEEGELAGLVLVRVDDLVKNTGRSEQGVYATRDPGLIERDFIPPLEAEVLRAQQKMAKSLALVGVRIPSMQTKVKGRLAAAQKNAAAASSATLLSMLPAASSDSEGAGES